MNEEGKLGRNQKIACVGYGSPVVVALLLCTWAMIKAPNHSAMLEVIDKWMDHSLIYVPIAMGSILLVSGAIKGVGMVTDAVARLRASK